MSSVISLGKKIKKARILKDMNQAELANKIGVSQAAVSMFEKDQRQPTPNMLELICKVLEVEKKDLVGDDGEKLAANVLMRNLKGLTPEEIQRINEFAEFLKAKR